MALANHKARFSPCGYPSYAIRIYHIWHVREVQAFPGLRARSRGGRGGKVFVLTPAQAEVRTGSLGRAPPRHTARGVDSAYERGGDVRRLA